MPNINEMSALVAVIVVALIGGGIAGWAMAPERCNADMARVLSFGDDEPLSDIVLKPHIFLERNGFATGVWRSSDGRSFDETFPNYVNFATEDGSLPRCEDINIVTMQHGGPSLEQLETVCVGRSLFRDGSVARPYCTIADVHEDDDPRDYVISPRGCVED